MRRIVSENPWERRFGYARAVRAGDVIAVSGTVAADARGHTVGRDAYEQTHEIFRLVGEALARAGASLEDAVRVRVYYAGGHVAEGFTRALAEAFPRGAPALTTVRVTELVSPEFLLEIEVDAVASSGDVTSRRKDGAPDWDEGGD